MFRSMIHKATTQNSLEGVPQDDQNSLKSESAESCSCPDLVANIAELKKVNIADKKLNKNGDFMKKDLKLWKNAISRSEYKGSSNNL